MKPEIKSAILKGLGRKPTFYLLRWSPTRKNWFRFDLVEIAKCSADGGIVTPASSQSLLADHAGHEIKSPNFFSLWTLLKVQLRMVK